MVVSDHPRRLSHCCSACHGSYDWCMLVPVLSSSLLLLYGLHGPSRCFTVFFCRSRPSFPFVVEVAHPFLNRWLPRGVLPASDIFSILKIHDSKTRLAPRTGSRSDSSHLSSPGHWIFGLFQGKQAVELSVALLAYVARPFPPSVCKGQRLVHPKVKGLLGEQKACTIVSGRL